MQKYMSYLETERKKKKKKIKAAYVQNVEALLFI